MGKYLTILAVVLSISISSQAAVVVTCAQVGTTAKFTVSYLYDGNGSAPRAFALDITTSKSGTTIAGVTATKMGESTSGSKGFGIFPGTIVIDTAAGTVSNIGTPVAPSGTPGALGGIGTSGVTVELGSLYSDSTGKPAVSGTLVTVSLNGFTSGTTTISIVPNTARSGVVLEDGTTIGAFSTSCTLSLVPPPCDCFCSALSTYARWVSSGKPSCWCPPTSVTGCPTGGTGYQCIGDAAQDKYPGLGYICYTTDFTVISNSWKKKIGDVGYNACADIAHDAYPGLNYGVYTTDFTRLTSCWKKTEAQAKTILGVGTTGGFCGSCTVPPQYR